MRGTKNVRPIERNELLHKRASKPRDEAELNLLKRIGEKIYRDLSKLGKSVEWLGFESETSRATVRRIFDGKHNIGLVTLDRIAKALGYKDVVEFFKAAKF